MKDETRRILIKEVGPRDGLQNEKASIPTEAKVELIQALVEAGHTYIEATAFVSPKAIPQLADAFEVAKQLPKNGGVTFAALVPNLKGMQRASEAGLKEVAVFTAASETFNQKNIQASIAESFKRFEDVFELAEKEKIRVRGYISTCFVCPYEGVIAPKQVLPVAQRLLDSGCYEVSIGDTIGKATPDDVKRLFEKLFKLAPENRWAGHFHDTHARGVENVLAGIDMGVTTFDASVGGLGGCPYAPGASGNVATEDVATALEERGYETGLSIDDLLRAGELIEKYLDHPLRAKRKR